MQYTIRNVPKAIDQALRTKAKVQGKSLNETVVDLLRQAVGEKIKYRDLSDIAGTWVEDPVFDEIRAMHDQIDPEMWR